MKYKEKLQENVFLYVEEIKRKNEERLFVVKDEEDKTISIVHAVIYKRNSWNNCILFRDALNKNADLRNMYLDKKEELALKYKDDRKSYTKEKEEVINRILETVVNIKKDKLE